MIINFIKKFLFKKKEKNIEVERKFLIKNLPDLSNCHKQKIVQGYLFNTTDGILRVRKIENEYYLTIKSRQEGISKKEYEIKIQKSVGEELINDMINNKCKMIIKDRYKINYGNHTWELDVFHGDNEGLLVAEIELSNEFENFLKPNWISKEISQDFKYSNSNLIYNPYKNWKGGE